ncbi:MAG TPA: hypothetical protein DCY40_00240 [Actinobacteria bacterium]|nr:hypothetical protein [Actinomycetota bacterium]
MFGRAPVAPVRPRRWMRRLVMWLVLLLGVFYVGVGWYVSGEIIAGIEVTDPEVGHEIDIVELSAGSITLDVSDYSRAAEDRDAVMGLRWEGGYARVGPATGAGTIETRPFTLLEGTPPPVGASIADLDGFAFPGDPTSLGLDFAKVSYPGPDGDLSAWFVPGTGTRWIVAVHGLGAAPREFLRMLDSTRELGMPTLIVSYRNDPGAPATEGALILAGQEEWEDVAAAVEYATTQGATDVVLYGASMGGALVLSYLLEEPAAPVAGVVLEAANADLRHAIDLRSGEALPIGGPIGDSFLAVGRVFTTMRTGIDFDTVDYVARADDLTAPMLVFHGRDDTTVPFAVGAALAAARPDLVEFHALDDTGHVRAWNEDPEAYRAILRAFLEGLGS